ERTGADSALTPSYCVSFSATTGSSACARSWRSAVRANKRLMHFNTNSRQLTRSYVPGHVGSGPIETVDARGIPHSLKLQRGDRPMLTSTVATRIPMVENGLTGYLNEIRRLPMLEPQQEYMLAERWRLHQDRVAAHALVTSHLRLVAKIA